MHGNNLTDAQLKAFVDLGVSFSITPENEMAQGHGHPITGRLRALGSAPSVGVDLESAISGDMFTVARMALASQRALDNAAERASSGGIPPTSTVPAAEALDWITTRGAAMLGMSRPHRQPGARQAGRYRGDVARPARHVAGARCRGLGRHAGLGRPGARRAGGRHASPSATAGLLRSDLGAVRARLAASGERILPISTSKASAAQIAAQ